MSSTKIILTKNLTCSKASTHSFKTTVKNLIEFLATEIEQVALRNPIYNRTESKCSTLQVNMKKL